MRRPASSASRRPSSSRRSSATSTACAPGSTASRRCSRRAARPYARRRRRCARRPRPSASASSRRPRRSPSRRRWKSSGDRLKALLEEWKAAPARRPRGRADACGSASPRRGTPSTGTAGRTSPSSRPSRTQRKEAKEALVAEADRRSRTPPTGATTADEHAQADGPVEGRRPSRAGRRRAPVAGVPRGPGHVLRGRAPRRSPSGTPDLSNNLAAKEALATEAERLAAGRRPGDGQGRPARRSRSAGRTIGHVPRADRDRVEGRLRAGRGGRPRGARKRAGGAATPRPARGPQATVDAARGRDRQAAEAGGQGRSGRATPRASDGERVHRGQRESWLARPSARSPSSAARSTPLSRRSLGLEPSAYGRHRSAASRAVTR